MKALMNNFTLMIQFFTRLPISINLTCETTNFRGGTIFLPLVGLIIGLFQWGVYFLLIDLFPSNITAIFVLLSGVLITGGFHLDGLGDTCDGFFAFKGKERIIEIMKDSRIGTYACIAIIIDLLLRFTAFSNLIDGSYDFGIITAPVMAKTLFVFMIYIGKQAKSKGTGNLFIGNVGKIELITAIALGSIINIAILGALKTLMITLICVSFTYLFNRFCEGKIGGLTGDILGANNEIIEMLTLILVIAIKV